MATAAGAAVFRLAPMAGAIRVLSFALVPLPAVLAVLALALGWPRDALYVAGFLAIVWLWIYLWYRPTRFEVGPAGLRLVWPMRSRTIPAGEVTGARATTAAALRAERGLLLRVGAGGLFGGFGMLWSSRGRHLDFYVSRTDGLVLVERSRGRPLLLTPERPEAFLTCVQALSPAAGSAPRADS